MVTTLVIHVIRLIYRPRRAGRLRRPGWFTYSGHLPTKWSHVNHRL